MKITIYIVIFIFVCRYFNQHFEFLVCSVAFFLSLQRFVERSNFDWYLQKLNNADSNNDIQI